MPIEIMVLLLISVVGIAGSIVLMVCNSVLSRRGVFAGGESEEELDDEAASVEAAFDAPAHDATAMDIAAEAAVLSPESQTREIKFTPLGQEPETVAVEAEEPVTAAPLRLVKPEDKNENCTTVGNIALSIGNAQDIGMRAQQQDAFAITPLEEELVVARHGVMAVVCDGMGGMENGAEAANTGAIQFMRAYLAADEVDNQTLVDAVYRANSAVYQEFQGKTGAIAGTTLVAASVLPDGLRFVSVGDSHIYLFRKNKLYQLNRDHNYFSELLEEVKAGRMTMEEAQRHPERAHLTSFVGLEKLELVDYNIAPVPLRVGDRILLCSDGLFKTLSLAEMTQIFAQTKGWDVQDELLRAVKAKAKRKQDNVTLVVLYCDAV